MSELMQALESRRLLAYAYGGASTIAMYTYAGDANLDGLIDAGDYGIIDNFVQMPGTDGYASGDFNYDGVIDGSDYGIIDDNNIQWQGSPFPSGPSGPTDFSASARRDVIVVTAASNDYWGNSQVNVSVNGKTTTTAAGKLKISGNGGNDKIHIDLPDSYADWLITILGGDGDDAIVGSMAAERIIAGEGNDYIVANGGRDTVYAEGGDDSVRGGGSTDLLDGGEGNDTLRGDGGNDRINGAGGIDRLRGSTGDDIIHGGSSKDFIGGEVGDDELFGDGGGDVLSGGEGTDHLDGGPGNDNCFGDAGIDLLAGGSGTDSLFGGEGHDSCENWSDLSEYKDVDVEDTGAPPPPSGGWTSGGSISGSGVQGEIQRVYNFGAWDQPGLTTSMPDAIPGLTTIGVATGEQVRGLGPTDTAIFAGQTITGSSTIAMYTYAGDANLDGVVDASDYVIHVKGDFNYDGVVDSGDYGIVDNNIQAHGNLPG